MGTVSPGPSTPVFRCFVAENTPDRVLLRAVGEVDLSTAPELSREVLRHVGRGAPVLLDAADIAFIDCAGFRVLLQALRREPRFALVRPSESVRRLLYLLDYDFPISDDGQGTAPVRRA